MAAFELNTNCLPLNDMPHNLFSHQPDVPMVRARIKACMPDYAQKDNQRFSILKMPYRYEATVFGHDNEF